MGLRVDVYRFISGSSASDEQIEKHLAIEDQVEKLRYPNGRPRMSGSWADLLEVSDES